MGNCRLVFEVSLISDIHLSWEFRSFADYIQGRLCQRNSGLGASNATHQAYQFHAPLVKFPLQPCERPQLRGAHGSKICRVREENGPLIADPLMKVNLAMGGLSPEIGCRDPEA